MTETPEGVVVTQDRAAIYIAARFSQRPECHALAQALKTQGHRITSRWVKPDADHVLPTGLSQQAEDAERRRFAMEDCDDVRAADWVVSLQGEPRSGGRGGRHVEFGYGLALGKRMISIGPRETVFHHLDAVQQFDTAEEFLAWSAKQTVAHTPTLRGEEVERLIEILTGKADQCEKLAEVPRSPACFEYRAKAQAYRDALDLIALASLPPSDVHTRQGVPDGWKLVPVVLTAAMAAGWSNGQPFSSDQQAAASTNWQESWSRLLAATPTAPTQTVSADRDVGEVGRLLDELQQAEAAYRQTHDLHGSDDRRTGRAWDLMRRAGNAARAALTAPPIAIHGETFPREAVAEAILASVKRQNPDAWMDWLTEEEEASEAFSGDRHPTRFVIQFGNAVDAQVLADDAIAALLQERQSPQPEGQPE